VIFNNRSIFALSVSVVALTWAGAAAADSPNIRGSYGFTGSAECLIAPGHFGPYTGPALPNPTPGVALPNSGFQPNLRPVDATPTTPTQAFANSFAVEGIRKFNRDGTGTVKGTAVGVDPRPTPGPSGFPSFPPSAGSSDFSFSFTYTVSPDGTWTGTMTPGSFISHHLTGPRAGQTSTVDAIPPVVGMTSQDGNTLIAAHVAPAVETVTYSNGDVWPMICHRSRVFIKLNDDDHNDDGGDRH
jgi:hypothetical protein